MKAIGSIWPISGNVFLSALTVMFLCSYEAWSRLSMPSWHASFCQKRVELWIGSMRLLFLVHGRIALIQRFLMVQLYDIFYMTQVQADIANISRRSLERQNVCFLWTIRARFQLLAWAIFWLSVDTLTGCKYMDAQNLAMGSFGGKCSAACHDASAQTFKKPIFNSSSK